MYFVKMSPDFWRVVKCWKYCQNICKFEVQKSFSAFPFEKENWLGKVGEVLYEVMSGYTM